MDSSSSSSDSRFIYDVFISFRGQDTRQSFVSHLHAAFSNARINTFVDNKLILKGAELGSELLGLQKLPRAIEKSRISIVVFSKNYTESIWCLNELEKIMECRTNHGQVVIPVFYDVPPSVVRLQQGAFGKSLQETAENRYLDRELRENVLSSWRTALTEAANFSGWDVTNYRRTEAELVSEIVDNVKTLKTRFLNITQYPVGLDTRVQQVIRILENENQSNKVFLMGIWGMGGLGKTTVAKAIYNQFRHEFKNGSFIENISEACERGDDGIIHLQEQLLENVLKTNVKIHSMASGITTIEKIFKRNRALIVLDDISTFEQVKALCGTRDNFQSGSVLIVTSRDVGILKLLEVDYVFRIKEMDENQSLELFSWHAFRQPHPIEGFSELSKNIADYCRGLPLALEVIGSSLRKMPKQLWEVTLSKLKRIPTYKVQKTLKISYDSLDECQKDIFLDICCFFIGKDIAYVTEILNGCGLHADIGIADLIDQSLIKVEKNNKLGMHNLLRDMGREIVRQTSVQDPGKRSRLWFHEDVHEVLNENTGTKTVKGLVLKSQSTSNVCIKTDSFKEMKNLRLLRLDRVDLTGAFELLSKELRWLHWQRFTCEYIPDDFYLGNLVVFELKHSNIKRVWNETKLMEKLKILNLSHSKYLTSTPDFSKLPNLEKLIMKDCPSLSEVHWSIGGLRNLLLINLEDCTSLSSLPENINQLKSLTTLILSGCSKIDKLEESIVQMESLTTLVIKGMELEPSKEVIVHPSRKPDRSILTRLPNRMYASSIRFCDQGLLQILKHEEVDDANMEVDQSEEVNMQLSPEWKVIPFQKPNRIIDTNLRVADMKMEPSEDAVEKGALVNDIDVNGSRMIEQIPYAVAESLFNRLASATFRDYGRIYGVMNELERLKNSVECIRAVLPDAEKKQEHDCVVQDWITSLKNVLHLADDLLDEFIIDGMKYKVDAGDKNQVTWVHSSSSSHNFLQQKMATEIEKIQQKCDDVPEEMAKLKLSPKAVVVKQTYSLSSKSNSFLLEYDITGREDDKKKIINLLKQPHGKRGESSHILTIAIGGIGGIGKTTLAQFVYNDVEVQNHFEKRMWVCVSNHFDVKTIVKKMLESLIDSKIDAKFSFEYIQHKLRENLTGERYLLVLDDICNDSHVNWTQLRTYLMCGSKDSMVLMTTRKTVSKIPEESKSYVLNGLTLDVSWSMLKEIVFGKETSGVNQKLEAIGKEIADKCNGVPLIIRTLGGLLQSKSEEREWINVLQGDCWKLYDDKENIMPILKLSYQNLPLRLKQCFAYCSLYPKNWEIKKDLLIQLWMAQGYLDCTDEKTLMEDVGNEFVKIFLMNSFFQDAKAGIGGDIVSFKMHNLMHDLATQVAGNDCCYLNRQTMIRVQRPIHVSLEPSAVHLLDSLDASRLRTLMLLSSNEGEELNGDELSVLSKFKHLRVLKLSDCSLSKLSSSIGELNHLRYLSLSHCRGLESLNKSISSLVLLQTLVLTPEEKFELSTEVVSKLINLRHLHISNWEASREETPSEFVKLSNLKYEGMVFSNWFSPLTNIVEISFFLCGNLQYLPPLERLPFLKSLHISFLEELEYMCYEQENTSAFFPSLESLSLQFCYKFRGWWRMGDDFNDSNCSQKLSLPPFSRLSQLSIIGCQMLTCMPAFPNLENRLELYNSCVETLVATLNTVALESLNHSPPLSMLKSLHIDGVSLDLKRIPKDWMQNLTSLQLLQINGFSCQAFQEIETWFKDDHKCLPSLQTIAFHNCEDLEALPDWICNLSSLQHLRVHDCINLTSLPEGMPCLTKLQTLEIIGCPFLDEECRHKQMKLGPKLVMSQR